MVYYYAVALLLLLTTQELYALKADSNGPSSNGAIRLVKYGTTLSDSTSGVVQVWLNGRWGNICRDDLFGFDEASVICHQLGWNGVTSYTTSQDDSAPISLYGLSCAKSNYLNIFQCSYSTTASTVNYCTNNTDVSITCYSLHTWDNPYDGQIRLQHGTYSNQGLVEVYCNGEWGTICGDSFGSTEATVVCHQLGYNSYYKYNHLPINSTGDVVWLHNVHCDSTVYNCIADCASCPSSEYHDYAYSENVTLECDVSLRSEAVVTPTFTTVDTCVLSSHAGPSGYGAIRLVRDGTTSPDYTSGVVQVWWNGQWGNICHDYTFGYFEADVVCHQLGWSGAESYSSSAYDSYDPDTAPAIMHNVNCDSSRYLNIFQCTYSTTYSCSADNTDVSVTCYSAHIWDGDPYDGQIRLQHGTYSNQGLVEVYCNGEWGTICNHEMGATVATVVCRQLGYNSYYDYNHMPFTGNASQKIWLENIECTSLVDNCIGNCASCPSADLGYQYYGHSEDMTVECTVSTSSLDSKPETVVDTCEGVQVNTDSYSTSTSINTKTSYSTSKDGVIIVGGIVGGVIILIILSVVSVICIIIIVYATKSNLRSGPRYTRVTGHTQQTNTGEPTTVAGYRLQPQGHTYPPAYAITGHPIQPIATAYSPQQGYPLAVYPQQPSHVPPLTQSQETPIPSTADTVSQDDPPLYSDIEPLKDVSATETD